MTAETVKSPSPDTHELDATPLPEHVSAITPAGDTIDGTPTPAKRRHRADRRPAPVKITRAPAEVMAVARRLAGKDPRRLRVNPDGSVTVRNVPPK